jgi:hypothetical protein
MGAELVHADVRRDMTRLMVAFRNFAKASDKRTTALLTGRAVIASASFAWWCEEHHIMLLLICHAVYIGKDHGRGYTAAEMHLVW